MVRADAYELGLLTLGTASVAARGMSGSNRNRVVTPEHLSKNPGRGNLGGNLGHVGRLFFRSARKKLYGREAAC